MWARKIIAASLTAPVYALVLAIGVVVLQAADVGIFDTVSGLLMLTATYLAVSFPVIVTYGVLTSIISDWVASRMSKRFEPLISVGLHIGFGLILLWLGVGVALLFWMIDRYLKRVGHRFESRQAWSSLAIPVVVAVTTVGIVYLISVIQNVMQRLYG